MYRGSSFVKGALILGTAGLLSRFLGAGLRVFLAAIMGDEGIGLYQMAYPIYTTLLAISTAGIPIAVSKLVAENIAEGDYNGAYRVFRTSFFILAFLGAIFSLLMFLGANFLVENIAKDPRAYYSLISISPAIFLVAIMSALRGFFQGQQNMMPTALSQLVEQMSRIGVVVILVLILIPVSLEYAAAGAAFGAVAGAIMGLLLLVFIYLRSRKDFRRKIMEQSLERSFSFLQVIYRILALSLPITLGSLVIPLVNLLDLSVVPLRLAEAGFTTENATALYGQLTGMANSIIQFPVILVIALAMSLVPAISEAHALQNSALIRGRTEVALRVTLFFSIPASAGLFVLAEPTTVVLFDNLSAAYPLSILAFGVIFLALYTSTSGILQGLGRPLDPVKNMLLGAAVKLLLSWFLTAEPQLNIGGAAFSTVIGFMVASLLNVRRVSILTGCRLQFGEMVLKPLGASILMSGSAVLIYRTVLSFVTVLLSERMAQGLALFSSITISAVVYVVVLFLIGGVRQEDLRAIPRLGPMLIKLARRLGLMGGR